MKKLLLATTMLVAGASVAAAEGGVTLSGDARMGLINDFGSSTDTTFTSRARVSFGLAGESESGLSFGASFRADNASDASKGTGGSVFISGAFGKLSMGDVDGAAAAAVGQVGGVGLTGLGDQNEIMYMANGGGLNIAKEAALAGESIPSTALGDAISGDPSVLYEYTAGSLSVYASVTKPGYTGTIKPTSTAPAIFSYEGDAYAVGAAYSIDSYKVSLGYERVNIDALPANPGPDAIDADNLVLGGDATFGGIAVKARYARGAVDVDGDGESTIKQYALSATYTMDALSVTAFLKSFDAKEVGSGDLIRGNDAIGLGASYDLGGGAKVVGGVVRNKTAESITAPDAKSETAFDLGVSLSF